MIIGNRLVEGSLNYTLLRGFFTPEFNRLVTYVENKMPKIDRGIVMKSASYFVPFFSYDISKRRFEEESLRSMVFTKDGIKSNNDRVYLNEFKNSDLSENLKMHKVQGDYLSKFVEPLKEFIQNNEGKLEQIIESQLPSTEADEIYRQIFPNRNDLEEDLVYSITLGVGGNDVADDMEDLIKYLSLHSTESANLNRGLNHELTMDELYKGSTMMEDISTHLNAVRELELERIYNSRRVH